MHFALDGLPELRAAVRLPQHGRAAGHPRACSAPPRRCSATARTAAAAIIPEDPSLGMQIPSIYDPSSPPRASTRPAPSPSTSRSRSTAASTAALKDEMAERGRSPRSRGWRPTSATSSSGTRPSPSFHMETMFGCPDGDFCHGLHPPRPHGPVPSRPAGLARHARPGRRPLPRRRRLPRRSRGDLHPRLQRRATRPSSRRGPVDRGEGRLTVIRARRHGRPPPLRCSAHHRPARRRPLVPLVVGDAGVTSHGVVVPDAPSATRDDPTVAAGDPRSAAGRAARVGGGCRVPAGVRCGGRRRASIGRERGLRRSGGRRRRRGASSGAGQVYDQGVTDTSIKVGFLLYDLGGASQAGFTQTGLDPKQQRAALRGLRRRDQQGRRDQRPQDRAPCSRRSTC